MKKKKSPAEFTGFFRKSPYNAKVTQLAFRGDAKLMKKLDEYLMSRGIICLKESADCQDSGQITVSFDLPSTFVIPDD